MSTCLLGFVAEFFIVDLVLLSDVQHHVQDLARYSVEQTLKHTSLILFTLSVSDYCTCSLCAA